ncbi:hypothetical protein RU99_GL001350 [Enterococcus casseliflavus]|nr:hypothetical protein RU99_GL001350 [Enterococcus casseliflavus]
MKRKSGITGSHGGSKRQHVFFVAIFLNNLVRSSYKKML